METDVDKVPPEYADLVRATTNETEAPKEAATTEAPVTPKEPVPPKISQKKPTVAKTPKAQAHRSSRRSSRRLATTSTDESENVVPKEVPVEETTDEVKKEAEGTPDAAEQRRLEKMKLIAEE